MKNTVKFAVMADPHFEIVPNGDCILEEFLQKAREENVDFIIHLGDFCYPTDTFDCRCPVEKMPVNVKNAYNKSCPKEILALLEKYNAFEKPAYHVFGNHEFDFASVEQIIDAYNTPSNYYSFHKNGWHFIVLDGNYIKNDEGNFEHYDHSHYFWKDLPWLPTEELDWLKKELENTNEPVVMFSHQPLFNRETGGIKNYAEFAQIVKEAKKRGKDVRVCVNGHMHVDELTELDDVLYYGVNSASNMWVDEEYQALRFSAEIEEKYPNVRYTIPYDRALFSIVTLDEEGISVKGVEGDYVQPGPKELGYTKQISASSSSWDRKWKK